MHRLPAAQIVVFFVAIVGFFFVAVLHKYLNRPLCSRSVGALEKTSSTGMTSYAVPLVGAVLWSVLLDRTSVFVRVASLAAILGVVFNIAFRFLDSESRVGNVVSPLAIAGVAARAGVSAPLKSKLKAVPQNSTIPSSPSNRKTAPAVRTLAAPTSVPSVLLSGVHQEPVMLDADDWMQVSLALSLSLSLCLSLCLSVSLEMGDSVSHKT